MAIKDSDNKIVTKSTMDKTKDKALSFKEQVFMNKRFSIPIMISVVSLIIMFIVTTIVISKLKSKSQYYVDYAAAYGRGITDLRNEHKSNDFAATYTVDTKRVDSNGIEYIQGMREDLYNMKQKDDEYFKEFIKPAFEYKNGNEYEAHREAFRKQLGSDNRFLTLVMRLISFYDPKDGSDIIYYASSRYDNSASDPYIAAKNACGRTASSVSGDWFKSYLVGSISGYGEETSYNYVAKIQATVVANNGELVDSTFMALYTMKDNKDGVPIMSNFECWPVTGGNQ